MTARGLFFEQSPPLWVPMRFFLTGPLFGLLAAVVIGWGGADAFDSRWTPSLLAATHLVTLGFLTMVMSGALLQLLPVIAGTAVPMPRLTAAGVHVPLAAGTLTLAAGLGTGAPLLLQTGLSLLAVALGVLLTAAGYALCRTPIANAVVTTLRLALAALLITTVLGFTLAAALARGWALPLVALTDLHLKWGLIGWVGLLVAGVAIQVVPMFQTTPGYPHGTVRWLARLAFLALAAITLAVALPSGTALKAWASGTLAATSAVFAGFTLYLQSRRRRRLPDPTVTLWRTAMASLLGCTALWISAQWHPEISAARAYGPLLGVVMVSGFAMSVVNGMLYKIAPFLSWLHMQNMAQGRFVVPNVREILPGEAAQRQCRIHLAAVVLLAAAALWPAMFTYPATFAAASSSVLLWWNLMHTLRVYRKFLDGNENPPTLSRSGKAATAKDRG